MIAQIVSVAANNTLRAWGEHNREEGSNAGVGKFLLGYGLFSLSSTVLGAFAAIVIWVFCSIRSAKKLHDSVGSLLSCAVLRVLTSKQMLFAVMRAPMSFFEQTPTGRYVSFGQSLWSLS